MVYIPEKVIQELKANNWQPNNTNRFNFYHFLKKIKRELGISKNNEDDDSDDILTAKNWPEKPRWKLKPESAAPVNLNLEELPELLTPNLLASEPRPDYLNKIKHLESQLNRIQQKNSSLNSELTQTNEQNDNLQQDLNDLSKQKAYEITQRKQIQQGLAEAKQIINQLEQKLITTENNFFQERQINHHLGQQLQTERETNTNLTQKLHAYEQNYSKLQNAYQNAIKVKESTQKQASYYEQQLKSIVQTLYQWQKLNYYQQQWKLSNKTETKIIQPDFKPPPWK